MINKNKKKDKQCVLIRIGGLYKTHNAIDGMILQNIKTDVIINSIL